MPSLAANAHARASGLLAFIRYGFMPNHLGYCGGNDNEVLFEHAVEGRADRRLAPLLVKFTGAFPYLQTIAGANGIADPLDARVVEAYWLGNELLEGVEASALFRSLEERFGDRLVGTMREQVLRKAPQGARPFHLFHVLDVYRHLESDEVGMAAMDSCRISWGQVTGVEPGALMVQRSPLRIQDGKLALGEPAPERVLRTIAGQGFTDDVSVGDTVSIHWGWACEVLRPHQVTNLSRWSAHHLAIANATI